MLCLQLVYHFNHVVPQRSHYPLWLCTECCFLNKEYTIMPSVVDSLSPHTFYIALIVTLCMNSNYNCHPLRCKRRTDQTVSTGDKICDNYFKYFNNYLSFNFLSTEQGENMGSPLFWLDHFLTILESFHGQL